MGSNNQSTTEFEKLKEALFGGYGFKPDPHISHSFAKISNVPTTGPITHIHNPIDNESILLNKETFDKYISNCVDIIKKKNIEVEDIRVDEYTGKKFFFFSDPDGLPIEFYEK